MSTNRDHLYHSFQVVFNTWYNSLCNYADSFLKDESACEDIVQDVFMRVWKDRPDLIGTEGIRYYLFTAVRNNCITKLRREKKAGVVEWEDEAVDYIQDKENGPTDYMALVQTAIEGLPPRCREVFLLSRISNMTYKEIAASLGISVKTVENQLSKALKMIRAFLKDKGVYLAWALVNIFL
jgi:RNA polymerase sigma-70 factor (ECF subfamily)